MSNTGLSANSKNIKKFQLQQKGRNILLILIIIVPLFIAGIIYTVFLQYADGNSTSAELVSDFEGQDSIDQTVGGTDSAPVYTTPDDAISVDGGSSSNSLPTSPAPAVTPSTPASSLPNGVTITLNSIETNGVKGSPYIADTLDVSQLPADATFQFDRNSWIASDANTGSINVAVGAFGTTYQGTVTLKNFSGVWKVTGYSL